MYHLQSLHICREYLLLLHGCKCTCPDQIEDGTKVDG